jgi:hypothetical protein
LNGENVIFSTTARAQALIYPSYSLSGGFWEKDAFLPIDKIQPYLKLK